MASEYLDPFGRLRGTKQWIVRGRIYLSAEQEGELRPRINEYPERPAIFPEFPVLGFRKGSPAPRVQGAAPSAEQQELPGGQPPGGGGAVGLDPYPLPRERDPKIPGGQVPAPGSVQSNPLNDCVGQGGTIIGGSSNVGAASTVISVQPMVPWPFIVTSYHLKTSLTALDQTVYTVVKVSDDGSTAGGENTTGVRLFVKAGGAGRIRSFGDWLTMFPEERQDRANQFVKFIFVNGSAAAVNFLVFLSIRRVDIQ